MANVLGQLFGDIAAAIREKTGEAQTMKPAEFPEIISGISTGTDVSSVTAAAADVLEGKTIVDASGMEVVGTMPRNNVRSIMLNTAKDSYMIPEGYHDGTGKVSARSTSKTVTPTKEQQTVYDDASMDAMFLSHVTVEPIPDKYQDVSNVTATAKDVVKGKVFVDALGNEIIGTMIASYIGSDDTIIFETREVGGFVVDSEFGAYTPGFVSPAPFVLENGKRYRVNWDGTTYFCKAFAFDYSGYQIIALGNASSLNQQGNDEPFLITYNASFDNTQLYSTQQEESHFVGIYRMNSTEGDASSDINNSQASRLRIKTGIFTANSSGNPGAVAHGLGTMPDFVCVQYVGLHTGTAEEFVNARNLMFSWAIKSEFGTDMCRGTMIPGMGTTEANDITDTATISVYCPNDEVFRFGASSGNGMLQPNGTYRWMAISGLGSAVQSKDLRYVTFMNDDGTVEVGKKAVATGDDCADPISRGIFTTPAKETTPQYTYTFAGWATQPNGGLNSNALKAVTEDRTVYANFVSVLRYYTVTFYDEDGTTILATKSYAYNAVPDYVPTKVGYTFDGWTTEIVPVTADASYVATWFNKVNFAGLTWAQVEDYAKNGDADKYIDLGAEKTFTTVNGYTVTARVIGFNHDDLADGTGKAGITMEMTLSADAKAVRGNGCVWYGSGASAYAKKIWWGNSDCRSYWNGTNTGGLNLMEDIPSDLLKVVKQVRKVAYNTYEGVMSYSDDYFWLPSYTELGFSAGGSIQSEGECYAVYMPNKQDLTAYPDLIKGNNGTAVKYYTRSKMSSTTVGSVDETGTKSTYTLGTSSIYGFACFCI